MKRFNILKRNTLKTLITLILCLNIFSSFTYGITELNSEAVVLLDPVTDKIIYSKNPYKKLEPASTTKVMTAIITLENCKLEDLVTIGDNPPKTEGSALGLVKGEVYTVRELLYALLLLSGNDCANALAEHIAGSVQEFAKIMTEKAKALGAKDTVFKNPSGLPEKGHITTAYDLSLIMKSALTYLDFVEISRLPNYFYKDKPYPDGKEKWAFNGNHCINENSKYYYKYALSGKTGYTIEANHTYTGAAKKDNRVLIASFLNAKDKDAQFANVGELFDYGFNNFETIKLIEKNEKVAEYKINDSISIPLLAKDDVYYTKNIENDKPEFSIYFKDTDISKQSISKDEQLFNGDVIVNGEKIDDVPLISGATREYHSIIAIKEFFKRLFDNKIFIILLLVVILIFFIIILILLKAKKRKIIRKKKFH